MKGVLVTRFNRILALQEPGTHRLLLKLPVVRVHLYLNAFTAIFRR